MTEISTFELPQPWLPAPHAALGNHPIIPSWASTRRVGKRQRRWSRVARGMQRGWEHTALVAVERTNFVLIEKSPAPNPIYKPANMAGASERAPEFQHTTANIEFIKALALSSTQTHTHYRVYLYIYIYLSICIMHHIHMYIMWRA